MIRESGRTSPWWRRGSAILAATVVSAVALTPLLVRDSRDAGTCHPHISEFTHKGRTSEVYTYNCGEQDGDDEASSAPPKGVLVHLHGDGAGEFDDGEDAESTLDDLAQVAQARNMVLIAPRTPDTRRGTTWWRRIDRNVAWLSALVSDRVTGDPRLDGDRIWWSGYSGGAEMLSYGILQRAHSLVTGGAVMMAGGGAPEGRPAWAGASPAVPLWWVVGDLDDGTRSVDGFDALTAARDGSAWYRRHGVDSVELDILPGVAHIDFPQSQVIDRILPS